MKMKKKMMMILFIIIIIALSVIIPTQNVFGSDAIYKEPNIIPNENQSEGLDDMIKDAQKFESEKGATVGSESGLNGNQSQTFKLNTGALQEFSSNLFSILLITATVISVFVGIYIGIKYMVGSVEEKADYKKMLLPYVAGCLAVYGALGIWKLVVTVLGAV